MLPYCSAEVCKCPEALICQVVAKASLTPCFCFPQCSLSILLSLSRLHRSVHGHSDTVSGHPVHRTHLTARQSAPQHRRWVSESKHCSSQLTWTHLTSLYIHFLNLLHKNYYLYLNAALGLNFKVLVLPLGITFYHISEGNIELFTAFVTQLNLLVMDAPVAQLVEQMPPIQRWCPRFCQNRPKMSKKTKNLLYILQINEMMFTRLCSRF